MKAYSINPEAKELKSIDIEMQANTVYSFFSSILIDELESLNGHIIYTDANAIEEGKEPYFLGEQLLVGNALIIGKDGLTESNAWILENDLKNLINYDVPPFYSEVFKLLAGHDVNLYRLFKLDNEEQTELNTEWVIYVFAIADSETQDYFLNELRDTTYKHNDVNEFIQKMAKLAYESSRESGVS